MIKINLKAKTFSGYRCVLFRRKEGIKEELYALHLIILQSFIPE
jgi:hypothetical protein